MLRLQSGVIGTVTSLGYLYCVACAERLEKAGEPVYADNSAHCAEACDACGEPLNA